MAQVAQQTSGIHLLMESLRTGGVTMMLIVLCSMGAVTVSIMTWLRMRENSILPKSISKLLDSLPAFAARGDISSIQDGLNGDRSVLGKLGQMSLSGQFANKQECMEAVNQKAREELHQLERDLPYLEVMVSVAPLLGLLGTTIGLVGMFSELGRSGASGGPDMTAVAGEIGVALRCTIAGLFVAIPSVVAHTFFVRKLDNLAMKLEARLHDTIQTFYQHFEVQRAPSSNS